MNSRDAHHTVAGGAELYHALTHTGSAQVADDDAGRKWTLEDLLNNASNEGRALWDSSNGNKSAKEALAQLTQVRAGEIKAEPVEQGRI